MQTCSICKKWIVQRVTDYEDGSRIVNLQAPEGQGFCEYLKHETPAEFGCNQFEEGHEHIQVLGKKTGSPWHHSYWGACPDCIQQPGWGCKRCAGSGKVLYYDDGYIGEEQTRLHPNEKKAGPPPPLKCVSCDNIIDKDWVACPYCGVRTNKPDEPIIANDVLVGHGGKAALT